ncbi:MAG: CoA transferase [Gammaproteobacteria bacterium]|nr:MAG: CoA transferase [Gammaproteobacteria bacterium]
MNGPLTHLRVLDLTHARAGPTAVRLLADWGAEVIKIEQPPSTGKGGGVTGARLGPDEQNLHRNKKSLTLNLKSPDGLRIFMDLARESDIVVENFKAEVKHRLGVDYEAVKAVNPAIIYASISGFGQAGPYGERAGVDQIVQGMSGLMSITGEPGSGPWRVGIAISDTSAGMFLGQGILMALLHRERTGEGQWVYTSLLEAMMNKLDFQGARYTMSGEIADQQGNDHPYQVPMGTYRSADGLVNVAAPSQRLWERMCTALEADDLLENPDYQKGRDRAARNAELTKALNALFSGFSTAEMVEKLNVAGVPCGPVNNIGEAFEDEQVKYLKMAKPAPHAELGAVNLIRSPINLSAFPQADAFDHAAPDPGQDSESVLKEAGYSEERIAQFKDAGVI